MNSTAHWSLPPDHPVFAGHFPGTPIIPGVMLLDAVLHSMAASGIVVDGCAIDSVKFLSPACPGESLDIHHARTPGGSIRFELMNGSRRIATGSVTPRASA